MSDVLKVGGGFVLGVGFTLAAGYLGGQEEEPVAVPTTMAIEATTTTIAGQPALPGEGVPTSLPTPEAPSTLPAPTEFAVEYAGSNIACRGLMQAVVDVEADRIDVNGTITWSSLKAMARTSGDDSYRRIVPSSRAEQFASEVMDKSGVQLADVNVTPPGTQFEFGISCVDRTRPDGNGGFLSLAEAFPPEN